MIICNQKADKIYRKKNYIQNKHYMKRKKVNNSILKKNKIMMMYFHMTI